ncbi:MAG: hypothetical protein ABIN08_11820 [Caldimonas sp.]
MNLPAAAPENWQFTAMVGAANRLKLEGFNIHRSKLDTDSPIRRILWEQTLQPFQLNDFDLYLPFSSASPTGTLLENRLVA